MAGPTLLMKWRLVQAMNADDSLTRGAIKTALALLDHCNSRTGLCNPSRATIAAETNTDLSTVKRSVRQLIEAGWFRQLANQGGRGHSTRYAPVFDRLDADTEERGAPVTPISEETGSAVPPFIQERGSSMPIKGVTGDPKRGAPVTPESGKETGKKPKDAKSYRFEGQIIRLNKSDFDTWQETFHSVTDLRAELMSIDIWLVSHPKAQKGWFYRVSAMLNRKHQANLAKQRADAGAESSGAVRAFSGPDGTPLV